MSESAYEIRNVKAELLDNTLLSLLSPSIFNPTPERLLARGTAYQNNPAVQVYSLIQNEKHMGIIVFEISDQIATIRDIAVDPRHQRCGIGSMLLQMLLHRFDVVSILAETDDDAIGFYRKCGFSTSVCGSIHGVVRYKCIYRRRAD